MYTPTTDEEWAIHAINIHGVFFERWCQNIVKGSPPWRLKSTNYPVEFPPPNGPLRGSTSALDILAELPVGNDRITLCIECKKNNPDFIDWVFFGTSKPAHALVSVVENVNASASQWHTTGGIMKLKFAGTTDVTDEARETRGNYSSPNAASREKTKTSNAAVSDAARQVCLATQAIATEEVDFSRAINGRQEGPYYRKHLFIPIIVSTARLFVCEFDPTQIDAALGTIPIAKAKLRPVDELLYEYPLPRDLQGVPTNLTTALLQGDGGIETFIRKHVLVVRSTAFKAFLDAFVTTAPKAFEPPNS